MPHSCALPQWAHTAAAARARAPSARARSSLNALFGALIAIVGATGVAVVLGHPIGKLAVHLSAVRSASLGTVMSAFLSLVWTVPIGVLVVVAHECGHVAGGLLVGWSFRLLFIGPVRIVRVRGRLRAEWHRLSYLHGGAALVTPRRWETARQFRRHRCWVVVGGPLASLLLACLAALSVRARSSPGVDIPHASLSVQFQAFTAFLSLMIGVGTLLPFRMGHGMRSDGLQLVRLLRVPTSATGRAELDAEDHRLQALLTALYLRPREWPDELVAQLSTLRGSEGLVMQYYRALDQAHVGIARDLLQRALDATALEAGADAERDRVYLALEAATFEALWRSDVAAAVAWRSWLASTALADPSARALVDAAICLCRR